VTEVTKSPEPSRQRGGKGDGGNYRIETGSCSENTGTVTLSGDTFTLVNWHSNFDSLVTVSMTTDSNGVPETDGLNDVYNQNNTFYETSNNQVSDGVTLTGGVNYTESTAYSDNTSINANAGSDFAQVNNAVNTGYDYESGWSTPSSGTTSFGLTHTHTDSSASSDSGHGPSPAGSFGGSNASSLSLVYHASGEPASTVTDTSIFGSGSSGSSGGGEVGMEAAAAWYAVNLDSARLGSYRGGGVGLSAGVYGFYGQLINGSTGAVNEGTATSPPTTTLGLLGGAGSQVLHSLMSGPELRSQLSSTSSTGTLSTQDGSSSSVSHPPQVGYQRGGGSGSSAPGSGDALPAGTPDEEESSRAASYAGAPQEPGVAHSAPQSRAEEETTPSLTENDSPSGSGSSAGGGGPVGNAVPKPVATTASNHAIGDDGGGGSGGDEWGGTANDGGADWGDDDEPGGDGGDNPPQPVVPKPVRMGLANTHAINDDGTPHVPSEAEKRQRADEIFQAAQNRPDGGPTDAEEFKWAQAHGGVAQRTAEAVAEVSSTAALILSGAELAAAVWKLAPGLLGRAAVQMAERKAIQAAPRQGVQLAEELASDGAAGEAAANAATKKPLICFPAGTPVHTPEGRKAIEQIAVGDRVWSYDHRQLRWVERRVLEVFRHQNQGAMATVRVNDETIRATGGHPFWVLDGEGLAERRLPERISAYEAGGQQPGRWVLAIDLRAGDKILRRDGEVSALDSVEVDEAEETVYNFRVFELENYAVGTCGILVHNQNEGGPNAPKGGEPNFTIVGSSQPARKVRFLPNDPSNPGWGLTPTHLRKHFFGNQSTALKQIDPGGTADNWAKYLAELIQSPVTGTTSNGMLDIIKSFPRADGSGLFQMGVRLAPNADGTFNLITVLTKQ
jgi:hypothetical protein